ncbi:MAG: NAD(P)H-dependent oxidoreductase [Pseudomonadota bacterium]
MAKKRIFVLNGHPAESSLNRTLAETYATAASDAGHEVKLVHLHDLDFDPDYGFAGYKNQKPLEPQIEEVLGFMEWSEHMVLMTPMWWGGLPAKLKGLFDRALLPGRTFNTRETNWMGLPSPMLTGRTGRVFLTSDTPGWFMRWHYHNALLRQLKDQIFGFVGIRLSKIVHFSGASHPKEGMVEKWISEVRLQGAQAA